MSSWRRRRLLVLTPPTEQEQQWWNKSTNKINKQINKFLVREQARCTAHAGPDGARRTHNGSVYASSLEWLRQGSQLDASSSVDPSGGGAAPGPSSAAAAAAASAAKLTNFARDQAEVVGPAGVRPVHGDILLIKAAHLSFFFLGCGGTFLFFF